MRNKENYRRRLILHYTFNIEAEGHVHTDEETQNYKAERRKVAREKGGNKRGSARNSNDGDRRGKQKVKSIQHNRSA